MNAFAQLCLGIVLLAGVVSSASAAEKIKVLIIDGQNNHNWRATTPVMKKILENTGLFTVDVSTSPGNAPAAPMLRKNPTPEQQAAFNEKLAKWKQESGETVAKLKQEWSVWRPNLKGYAAVISNYNGEAWPEEVRAAFVDYVSKGGGFVSVHAANNSFPEWPEYNAMIGLGGWGGRNEKSGPYLRLRDGKFVKDATTPGAGGGHGAQHEYLMVTRDTKHPITKGLPKEWRHAKDELYHQLRGPADHITVLASAYSDKSKGGTGEDEPLLMVLSYGKGRVFHTALGHDTGSMQGLGFQITLQRGVEWAATGKVKQPAPKPGTLATDKATLNEVVAK